MRSATRLSQRSLAGTLVLVMGSFAAVAPARAQTDLPNVTVTAPYTRVWGGYVISGNFRVDAKMPTVVFPAKPLRRHDILVVQPVHLDDNDYLVLQECASENCHQAKLVRVWTAVGSPMPHRHGETKVWIRHENKYWLWIKRLPDISARQQCDQCGLYFSTFDPVSPPMTLIPEGALAAYYPAEINDAEKDNPIPVKSSKHEGSTFVVTYADGSIVRIRRERAAKYVRDAPRRSR